MDWALISAVIALSLVSQVLPYQEHLVNYFVEDDETDHYE